MALQDWLKKSALIKEAYLFAKQAHQGQKRKTGEPYINHCVAAAEAVAEWGLDETTIAAALLHDTVEDCGVTVKQLEEKFGKDVAFLVDGVTKVGQIKYKGTELEVENLRKFMLYLCQDVRVLLVRIADRLHNMKTLYALPPHKQKRIALETMDIFAPLAYRMGMHKISGELEDLSFPYIYPEEYKWLLENAKEHYMDRMKYLERITPNIAKLLRDGNLGNFNISYRAKRYTSLYKKLLRYDMDINSIYDLVALRIITDSIENCYKALGIIHQHFQPLPKRIKDYIALPKPNGYQSIHTTIFGPENKILEVQIRTAKMHEETQYGIAAHFAYQEMKGTKAYNKRSSQVIDLKELTLVKQLSQWQKSFTDDESFIQSLKLDFFKDRIFVISPKGDVFDMPLGSTPIDYAFQVHTDVGSHCAGAKVNGRMVPLDHKLQSGDLVEIITQKNKKPSKDWLNIAFSAEAKKKIKSYLGKIGEAVHTPKSKPSTQKTMLSLDVEDKIGLLQEITKLIAAHKINIASLNTQNQKYHSLVKIKIVLDAAPKETIQNAIKKIRLVKGVKKLDSRLA